MAHELNIENGQASMMFVGDVPWHGLGTRLLTAPKTAAEAIEAAGLNWEVGLKRVYAWEQNIFHEFPDRRAIVRLDKWGTEECEPFGLVGSDYQVLQNRQAFDFFDPIVETGKVEYHTAGALGGGEKVWVLAKVSGEVAVRGVDKVEKYLLLSNGHDGRTALQIRFTPVRVVCQNTLSAAVRGRGALLKAHHGADLWRRLDEVQAAVKEILGYYDDLAASFEAFATKAVKDTHLKAYHESVFPNPRRKTNQSDRAFEAALGEVRQLRSASLRLFEEGRGNQEPLVRGTLWAAYTGVTELVDHQLNYGSRAQRLNSLWFGDGERIKQKAFDEAMVIAKAV